MYKEEGREPDVPALSETVVLRGLRYLDSYKSLRGGSITLRDNTQNPGFQATQNPNEAKQIRHRDSLIQDFNDLGYS